MVLGGYGETGRRLARLLVERTEAHVVVAGRDARRAAALAAELGAQRVREIGLDAADAPSVRRALEGVDLLVIAAVVPRHVAVLRARRSPPERTGSTFRSTAVRRGSSTLLAVRLFHEDGYDLTAIAGESMAEQVLKGSAWRPGLHRMGLIVDPERLLADMHAMGVRVETSPVGR